MKKSYFKFRAPLDFNPSKYEIGNPISTNRKMESNFFLKKLCSLDEKDFVEFYSFHQQHFLKQHPGEEKPFYKYVLELVNDRIDNFKSKKGAYSSESDLDSLGALRAFKKYLTTIDKWSVNKSLETMLAEKEVEITAFKAEISALEAKLKAAVKFDVGDKIRLVEGSLPILIDIMLQIQNLTLPDGRKLAKSQAQSPWYKMIAKYFQHGNKDISVETIRNYFPADKSNKLIKGSEVSIADKLFEIKSVEKG